MAPQNPPQNTAPGTIPPPPETDPAFQQSELVNDVRQDWKERLFGALAGGRGGSLDDAIQRHHQGRLDEARMHRRNASTATGNYYSVDKLNRDPTTGDLITDPDVKNKLLQQYATEYQSSMGNYAKIAGVNPQTKQAIQKAQAIVDHLTGIGSHGQGAPGQPAGQGAAAPTPQYGTTVSDTGVSSLPTDQGRQGGLQPPPNYRSNVSDAGVSFSAPPTPTGGGATAQVPQEAAYTDPTTGVYHPALKHRSAAEIENMGAAPPPSPMAAGPSAPSAPPQFDYEEQAPFIRNQAQFQQGVSRKIEGEGRVVREGVQNRSALVDKLGYDEDDPAIRDFVLTGNIASGALQGMFQQGSKYIKDSAGVPRLSIFNKRTGKYLDPNTMQEIPGATPMSASDLATHTINLMTPDGPRTMMRAGNKVYDNHGVLQDGELVPFQRGMVPTTNDREVEGYLPDGTMVKYLLRSTHQINIGPIPSPTAQPAGAAASQPSGAAAPAATQARPSGIPPAPKVQGAATGATSKKQGGGVPGAITVGGQPVSGKGQFFQFAKGATGVDQARNSLVGDNIEKGQVGGLAKDLSVFKNPDSMKRIGEYLQLVHNQAANEGDSFAHSGDTFGAVKWFAGLPQLNISLQQGALRDQYGELTTDEKKFVADYFRVMGTMGGMRASTGMPGYQWAFTNMYNEMPTPGKVNDYDDAVRRLTNYVNETNVVSKHNRVIPQVDVENIEKQIRGGGVTERKGGAPAPPKATSKAINF